MFDNFVTKIIQFLSQKVQSEDIHLMWDVGFPHKHMIMRNYV